MSKVFLQVPVNVAETKFNDMYFPFPEEPHHSQPVSSQAADFFAMEKKPKKKRAKLPRKARTIMKGASKLGTPTSNSKYKNWFNGQFTGPIIDGKNQW